MSVRIRGLSKSFTSIQALAGVDIEVGEDELLVVLGPTGAGKTTLLRCLAGLEQPDAGSIEFDGRDATRLSPAERDVALVFQNFSLYGDWTVRENLAFPLRAPGRNLNEVAIKERIVWAANMLALEALLDRPANRLSGGQMQRVAIGRAIVRRPSLFLLDEPLTNLDAKLREQLRVELAILRRDLQTPMIYVTHDQAEALSMGDRIVVIDHGRVLQIGTPEDIYQKPQSVTVARLLGQPRINCFPVTVQDGQWISADGSAWISAEGAPSASHATIGIRPEHIAVAHGNEAEILRVEHLGPVHVLTCRWRGQQIQVLCDKGTTYTRGQCCALSYQAERVHCWPTSYETS